MAALRGLVRAGESTGRGAPTDGGAAPVVLALLVALGAFAVGSAQLGRIETGAYSERITLAEGHELVAGHQRFGVVRYTHFPNGPLYLVAAMTAAGLEPSAMRLVPVGLAAVCFGLLAWALASWVPTRSLRAWVVAATGVLLLQPAVFLWMGALHEHSYAFSMVLLLMATSVRVTPRRSWLLFPLGFVSGWIGYDWLPGQAMTVLTIRWLVLAGDEETPLLEAAAMASLDSLKFASGACLAVLAHLIQLALFFDSWDQAARDLLGAAAARANAGGASQINPEYQRFIEQDLQRLQRAYASRPELAAMLGSDFSVHHPPRLRLTAMLYQQFRLPRWSNIWLLAATTLAGIGVMATRGFRSVVGSRAVPVGALGAALAVAAPAVWVFLMPEHAVSHLHMLPRHILVPVALLLALPALLARPAGTHPPAARLVPRAFARATALYALWPVLLAAAGLHAALTLG